LALTDRNPLVQTNTITASILRTHSQCQRGASGSITDTACRIGTDVFITWKIAWLRYGNMPVRWTMVEPIGIEPMT
jgi:alpha-mannosidase